MGSDPIFLFTDFGAADIYVGQIKAVLARTAPGVPVIDLLNDAPRFGIEAAAHLLAALVPQLPSGSVTIAVVDPGVGTDRRPIALHCDERWFVGPDNGLLSVLAARASSSAVHEIVWRPDALSRSFHGRDLFAPIAARIAAGSLLGADLQSRPALDVRLDGGDLWKVIHVDHYGNVVTGVRSAALQDPAVLVVAGVEVSRAGIFGEVAQGQLFWYVNSIGLVEIACNQASAGARLQVQPGDRIARA